MSSDIDPENRALPFSIIVAAVAISFRERPIGKTISWRRRIAFQQVAIRPPSRVSAIQAADRRRIYTVVARDLGLRLAVTEALDGRD